MKRICECIFHNKTEYRLFLTSVIIYTLFERWLGLGLRHIALTHSIVRDGTLWVDNYRYIFEDTAVYNGHHFLSGLPAPSFLAVPFYAVFNLVFSHVGISRETEMIVSTIFINVFTNMLPTCFIGILFYRMAGLFTETDTEAVIASLAFYFGSMTLPLATDFTLADTGCMLMCFLAFYILFKYKTRKSPLMALAAGLSLGLGCLMSFQIIPAALATGCYALFVLRRKHIPLLIFSVGIFVFLQAAYNKATFGGYFATYLSNNQFLIENLGNSPLEMPPLRRFYELTFSPLRGFFIFMPIMIFSLFGAAKYFFHMGNGKNELSASLNRKGIEKKDVAALIVIFIFCLVTVASYKIWHGAAGWGPRYLATPIPFMILLSSMSFRYFKKEIIYFFLAASILFNAMGASGVPIGGPLHLYFIRYFTREFNPQFPFVQLIVISRLFPEKFHSATWVFIFSLIAGAICATLLFFLWRPVSRAKRDRNLLQQLDF